MKVLNAPPWDKNNIYSLYTVETNEDELIKDIYAIKEIENTEFIEKNYHSIDVMLATAKGLLNGVLSVQN